MDSTKYYVVKKKALPEVLIKVEEVKKMLDANPNLTVQDAADKIGISRSSFYKYKDDIRPFHENEKGQTLTLIIQMDDKPGVLSAILHTVAKYCANILTIHQSIPINGIASLTLSVDVFNKVNDVDDIVAAIEQVDGIHYVKIIAKE